MFALLREVKPKTMGGSGARVRWRGPAALALVSLLLGSGAGCRTAPIHDIVDAPLPAACGKVTTEAVDEAIWRAGRKVGWKIELVRPGLLRGAWRFKHHEAVVSISHANGRFSIRYEKSENMLHDGDQIHRNYNRLVERLAARIRQEPLAPELDGLCPVNAAAADGPARIRQEAEEVA